ncbi:MAG: glycosyltransferase [Thermoplasmata archaeon]|nr:glycosyltransferase [Thermoplasmata archaeon]
MTATEGADRRLLVIYPPGIGYYVDREFPVLIPGYSTVYALPDPQIASQFRTPPSGFVYPEYVPVVRGLPGSPLANRHVRDLPALLDAVRPSLVVTYECFSSLSDQVARSPRRAGFRHVVLCYETVPAWHSLWGWFPLTRRYARRTCHTADLLVAHSAKASVAAQSVGAPAERILVRSPGVYPPELRDGSLPIATHAPFEVTYIGSLTRNKGVLTLVDAALRLRGSQALGHEFRYSLIGEGPLRHEIEQRAAPLGDRLRLLGRVDEATKAAILAQSSVLVYPSLNIRFGPFVRWEEQTATAAMEAMAAGVPVIASDSGALPEIVGDAGLIFPRGSANALAERLSELGESVVGESMGYTKSHQVALDVTRYGDGGFVEKKLETMNIIANRQLLPGDLQAGRHYTNPGGVRLGVSELTRLGMKKDEMQEVADILHLALNSEKVAEVKRRVSRLRKSHQTVHYSFKTSPAYFYGQTGAKSVSSS